MLKICFVTFELIIVDLNIIICLLGETKLANYLFRNFMIMRLPKSANKIRGCKALRKNELILQIIDKISD